MNRLSLKIGISSVLIACAAVVGVNHARAFGNPAPHAAGNLRLLRATPGLNDTLTVPPTILTLWFSEPPDLTLTSVKLTDPDHAPVSVGVVKRVTVTEDKPAYGAVEAAVADVKTDGLYTVAWKAGVKGGALDSGTYTFRVAPHGTPKP